VPSSDFQLKRSSLSDQWGEERRGEERRGEEVRNINKHVPEEAGAVGLYLLVFRAVDPPIRSSSGRCIRVSWPTHQQTAAPPTCWQHKQPVNRATG